MKRWKGLTFFEIGMLFLGLIATLAWLYLVYKITATLDPLQKALNAMLATNTTMG